MKNATTLLDTTKEWYETLADTVKDKIITPILVLLAAVGVIYAIIVGIRFVKAEDKSGREEAKQKLVTVLIGIGVTLVLISLFIWLGIQLNKKDSNLNKWRDGLIDSGYRIVYDEDGGTSVNDASGLEVGDTITLEKAPTKEGYTFKGWSINDGAAVGAETKYTVVEDTDMIIEVKAIWEKNP